jgi:flagellar hook-associated protein 1
MATVSSALGLVTGALDADQSALDITANNVANANTTGYAREVPTWSENSSVTISGIVYGTGVSETGPTSVWDGVLNRRLDQQQQMASASTTRLSALNAIQALFAPDSGSSNSTTGDIGSDITGLYQSFSALEANPTDNALRQQVLNSATTLAGDISDSAASLDTQQQSLDQEAAAVTTQVNALTASIAQLNRQIQSLSAAGGATTLEDQRQEDISQLSQLVGINQVTTENQGLSITTTSGQLLVSEDTSFNIETGTIAGVNHFFLGGADVTSGLAAGGGQLGGYLTARDQDIPYALAELDQLAFAIETSVNALNNAGTDGAGVEGTGSNSAGISGSGPSPLYVFDQPVEVAGSARSMCVVMSDPNQISAASFGNGVGDDSNAVTLANLANVPIVVPTATSAFGLTQNLSSATPPGGAVTGTEQIYDALGNTSTLTVTYLNQGGGQWAYSIAVGETLKANTSSEGQVSFGFGPGETVDPATNLTISGLTNGGNPSTIVAPFLAPGEQLGDGTTGYVKALNDALTAAGIVGVTVTNANGVLTITGATATAGNVTADAVPSASATGTLQFNAAGDLTSPAANVGDIAFSGFSDGAAPLNLTWELYGLNGASNITQTPAPSGQSAQTQNGTVTTCQSAANFYSSFVSQLGATASEVQTENTALNASVTQLQTQQNTLSGVNLNDEASSLQELERSYQAASQIFAILNTVIASALNLGVETAVS